ncbi:MAG: NAD(P)-dependent oxidoreductase [Candidatus Omnitrophica bacterium]|nr:NAD(P)-dependent oxidoreductase [Candidatus Omnitrophota bacterium]
MKIVVFGGSGFLGSHVADYLTENNHKVLVFDKRPSPYLKPSQEMIIGDILDREAVKEITKGVDIVYHFAGIVDINQAKDEPYQAIYTNIIGTTNILEACRLNNVKRFIFASSVYVYSEAGSFYRASKQACEIIIENYHKQYNVDFTILRYGSLYGPRADESNWINTILKQALSEKKITRIGDGNEIREYIHVYDAARLSVKVSSEEYKNQYVMITGHQSIRIKDLLVMIKEMLNNEIELEFTKEDYDEHYEITPYNFRPKLAKRLFDSSYVDLGQGLLEQLHTLFDKKTKKSVKA